MSLIKSLFETLDGAFAAFGKFLRQDARMYCNLETADSKFNLKVFFFSKILNADLPIEPVEPRIEIYFVI